MGAIQACISKWGRGRGYIGRAWLKHCSEKHLHRYLAEFDFRYNNRVALVLALSSHLGVFADRRRTKPFTAILEKSGLAWSEKFELT